jgi:cytochrome P450/NADPH-cytochrome P450 reductase
MKLSNVMMTSHESNGGEILSPVPVIATPKRVSSAATTPFSSAFNIEPHDGKLSVYFGSNMGTCEEISSALCDEADRMGFDTSLDPLDAASSKGLSRECINLIVTSTYNGQPPDNAKKFAEYLKTLQPGSLSGIKVAICGVGNSNWKSFQSFPCSIINALESAGADIICPRGIADEEKDLKSDVGAWRQFEFWPSAFEAVGLDPAQISSDSDCTSDVPKLNVTECTEQANIIPRSNGTKLATVISARELQCSTSDRSTRHIELKLPNGMNYREGDHIAVFPENNSELILQIASLLNEHDLGRTVKVSSTSNSNGSQPQQSRGMGHLPFDVPVRVSDLLARHVDLQAPASAAFINLAAESASCLKDREVLKEISELICDGVTGNLQELRPAQVLLAFPSIKMSLGKFLANVAPMKKRYYSISSSPTVSQNSGGLDVATVTVGLVKGIEKTVESSAFTYLDSKEYRGVSSGFLADVRPGQLVEISIGTNDRFRLPEDPSTPVIMIGPGTGIAPFRGFYQAIEAEIETRRRPAMLFFGCRNEQDYLYQSELESAPIELQVAFSRPTTPNTKKKYVQDLLWSNRDRVWKYLEEEKAHIYICGDGRYMAKDVDNTLHRIARECGNMSESDAIAFYDELQGNNRYLQDVWC